MDLCRLCLTKSLSFVDAKSASRKALSLRIAIYQMFSIQIIESDGSTLVCFKCVQTVEQYYRFFRKVQESQSKFPKKNIENETDNSVFNTSETQHISTQTDDTINTYSDENVQIDDPNSKSDDCNERVNETDNEIVNETDNEIVNETDNEISTYNSNDSLANQTSRTDDISKCDQKYENSNKHDSNIDTSNFPTNLVKNGKFIFKPYRLQKIASEFYSLKCELCGYNEFINIHELMIHYKNEHDNTKGYVTCCGVRLYKMTLIFLHMARHLQPSAFECKLCDRKFLHLNSLGSHLETHLPRDERSHKCDHCGKRFVSEMYLKKHMKRYIMSSGSSYICKICNKFFKTSILYYNHKITEHKRFRYLCYECGKVFKRNSSYLKHLETTHQPYLGNTLQCDQCDFVSKNKTLFNYHKMQHNEKRFICDLCNFVTTKKFIIKEHITVEHTNNNTNNCTVCGKKFKIKKFLIDHMSKHEFLNCPYCPKKFFSSENFYSHKKNMHSDLIEKESSRNNSQQSCREIDNGFDEMILSMQKRAREEIERLKNNS